MKAFTTLFTFVQMNLFRSIFFNFLRTENSSLTIYLYYGTSTKYISCTQTAYAMKSIFYLLLWHFYIIHKMYADRLCDEVHFFIYLLWHFYKIHKLYADCLWDEVHFFLLLWHFYKIPKLYADRLCDEGHFLFFYYDTSTKYIRCT